MVLNNREKSRKKRITKPKIYSRNILGNWVSINHTENNLNSFQSFGLGTEPVFKR